MIYEKKMFAVTGAVLDNNLIYWTSWKEKKLFKYNCKTQYIMEEYDFSNASIFGETICKIIKYDNSIIMISFDNAYEILKYDLQKKNIEILYQEKRNINIFNSFLVEDKIYIFPDSIYDDIIAYSIKEGNIMRYSWNKLSNKKFDKNSKVYYMESYNGKFYGTFYDTNCLFELSFNENFNCKFFYVKNDFRLSSIGVFQNGIYSNHASKNSFIYISNEGKTSEIELYKEENDNQEGLQFCKIIKYGEKIFFIPNLNDYIYEYNVKTGKCSMIKYPPKFHRLDSSRLFWDSVEKDNLLYLFPHSGNGLLILNMDNSCLKFVEWAKTSFIQFLQGVIQL